MTKKRNPDSTELTVPNKHDHGALVSAAKAERALRQREEATRRLNERNEAGRFVSTISDQDWNDILDRIAAGETDAQVMKDYGVERATIIAKRHRDPAFAERYYGAVAEAFVTLAQDIRQVTRGVEGYSTGDVRRDELVAKYDLELAKRFANKILGDKVQVDQRSISINIDRNDPNGDLTDW